MLEERNSFPGEVAVAASQRNKERDYWLNKFSGDLKRINFPYDYNRSSVKGRVVGAEKFAIRGRLFSRLMEVVGHADVRLHMVIAAVVVILLNKYTGNRDIIIGSPVLRQEIEADYINTVLGLRNSLESEMTFKQLLFQVRQTIVEAAENQNYPIKVLLNKLNMPASEEDFPLFDVAVLLENIHDKKYIRHINLNAVLSFLRTGERLHGVIEYNVLLYDKETIERLVRFFIRVLETVLYNADIPLSRLDLLSREEKNQLLIDFNDTEADYPRDTTIHELFDRQARSTPDKIAVIFEDEFLSYQECARRANGAAHYLYEENHVGAEEPVGLLMERSIEMIIAVMGILKSGAAYVPLDPSSPEERLKRIINNAAIGVVISQARHIQVLNRLQWECGSFHTFLCQDAEEVYAVDEKEKSGLMDAKLWEYVGETAVDEITGGGWFTSYTNEPFSKEEMDEYGDNILQKLKPLLHDKMRILEIGCASGISMYRLAPLVGFYWGTDLSDIIIKKNEERLKDEGHKNIVLSCAAAHEIDKIGLKDFDIVIMNSVIHNFHGHNYLRKVIKKAVDCMVDTGYIFIGDVMDQDLKEELVQEMIRFKKANKDKGYRTKTDWSAELFVSRAFFEDLRYQVPGIQEVEFSEKIYTLENELTKFRYDVLLKVEKNKKRMIKTGDMRKWQHDLRVLARCSQEKLSLKIEPDNLAYVIYTSGSTGEPKGVMVEHRSVVNRLNWMQRFFPIGADDVILQKTPVVFDVSVWELFWWALSGASVCFLTPGDEKDPYALTGAIEKNKITTIHFVPAMLNVFLKSMDTGSGLKRLTSLRQVFASGEALQVIHVERFNKLLYKENNTRLINLYGPTEAAVDVTYFNCSTGKSFKKIPIGKPIDNIKLYIIDNSLKLVAIGIPGELCISGVGVARGYLKEERLTAERFVDNPYLPGERMYRTGDLARWLMDGNIEFLGRIDHQVKIRGYRIELGEIESQLLKHENIREAVVIVKEEMEGDKYLCAYVVLNPSVSETGKMIEISELKNFLATELPDYMIPSYFVQLEKMPLTVGGKIDRKVLSVPEMVETEEYTAPKNEIEEKLQTIWSEVLGIEKKSISTNDNFFELGGHSLKAVVLVSMIRKEFSIEFPFANVFSGPTIVSFAEFISQSKKSIYPGIKAVEKKEYYSQSSAQKRLFFLDHFEETGTIYNIPVMFPLGKELDKDRLESAIRKLIARHESLRTSFEMKNDTPIQIIHKEVEFGVEFVDLDKSMPSGTAVESSLEIERLKEVLVRPFDLSRAPLLRAVLIKIREKDYMLFLDNHHIITDGISHNILFKDYMDLYSDRNLMPLRLQYKDYSEWQTSREQQKLLKQQGSYWVNLFPDEVPLLNLPMDFPRPSKQSFAGDSVDFVLNKEETRKLKDLARETDVTLYMMIFAIFNILLAKLSGQEDVIVGTPISGRSHADFENIVGMFANTLVMLNYPCEYKSFKKFLQEVKEQTLKAFENQEYQFEELVEKISVRRDASRNPIFDVVFSLLNFLEYQGHLSGDENPRYFENRFGTKFDLMLTAVDFDEEICFYVEYCTKLFKRGTIKRFIDYFRNIVSHVIGLPDCEISDIKIISEEEKQELLSITPLSR